MKKALRIGYNRWYCDENFAEHIAFIKKNIARIDEVTLFDAFAHHGYWTEEFDRKNAEILTKRIEKYREAGVKSVGINVLNTRGHTADGYDYLPAGDLQPEIDVNGNVTRGCLCLNNEPFLNYIAKRYAIYASTGTDFLWEDDDVRPGNGMLGCMCDGCIEKFNTEYGYNFDRPTLVAKIKADPEFKKIWRKYQMDIVIHLEETIYKAVKAVDPKIKLGYMSIFNDGYAISACGAEMIRPGGGFYDERTPLDMFIKGMYVQEQISQYPEDVKAIRDIQYEYEAFNYQTLDKSARITETETTMALMSGCTGVLYNNDIFYDRQSLLDMLAENGKKWDALTDRNEDLAPIGVFARGGIQVSLHQIGIPVTQNLDNARCCAITGTAWNSIDDATVEKIFAKGVYTDGEGLEILTARGFGHLCGGKVKAAYKSGMAERFADHPLNGDYVNHYRDAFMNFTYYHNNTGCAYELTPVDGAEVVSRMESITHEKMDCSLYIYENAGKRVAVDGYVFPNSVRTHGKKEQLNNIFNWLSGGKLPVKTPETIKIVPGVCGNAKGDMTIMLTNASLDKTGIFKCLVRTDRAVFLMNDDGTLTKPEQEKVADGVLVTVPSIDAWDYTLLTNMP